MKGSGAVFEICVGGVPVRNIANCGVPCVGLLASHPVPLPCSVFNQSRRQNTSSYGGIGNPVTSLLSMAHSGNVLTDLMNRITVSSAVKGVGGKLGYYLLLRGLRDEG